MATKIFQIGMDEVLKMEQEENDISYDNFKNKFIQKKTTDDCYTPQNIYDAIAEWVEKEYGKDRKNFIRPFWPGADYKEAEYFDGSIVVDNPPFSILAEIIKWYCKNNIKFFLFAPALTLFSNSEKEVCYIATGCPIKYENGAVVGTSFVTNLDNCKVRTCPELYKIVIDINDKENNRKKLQKYEYPNDVISAAIVNGLTHYGIEWRVENESCIYIEALDKQKEKKIKIFGGGFLLSKSAAEKHAEAEAKKVKLKGNIKWELSEREKEIVSKLK